ncbi:heparinase II/III family protein [Liberiplasma polymorphum]|uniref:heparinase II/III family protein n=1 Tax=Liberiplasma polymorphum TaxID=3374570 RepID=UPI00377168CA
MKKLRLIIKEFGLIWTVFRFSYILKLKALNLFPVLSFVFEKKVHIKKLDIFNLDFTPINSFLSKLDSSEKDKIIFNADNAINGLIYAFESTLYDYGNPIQWNYNPTTGKTYDLNKKWFQIKDFDRTIGDIKIVWEPSRFKHLFILIRAHMLTKDIKYYNAFSTQLSSWIKTNKYGYGPNYKCGQEATLRMINVLLSYKYFAEVGLANNNDEENVLAICEGSYKKVLSNFYYAHRCIKNNHTFTEIIGLVIGSKLICSKRKLVKSITLLDKEITKQFTNDGGFTQYSFNYQRFTLQLFEHFFNLKEVEISDLKNTHILTKSLLQLYNLQNKSGEVPNYGSNDGALIFPVSNSDYSDYRPMINALYAKINNKKLYMNNIYDEELLWNNIKSNIVLEELRRETNHYNNIGHYVYRFDKYHVFIPLQEYKSRPAHMDQLHLDLWVDGVNVLSDSGTYSYASKLGQNLSKTAAHNVPYIDIEQMNKISEFMVLNRSKSRILKLDDYNFIGECIFINNYTHVRQLQFANDYFYLKDKVLTSEKEISYYFHTPLMPIIENGKIKIEASDKFTLYIEYSLDLKVIVEEIYQSKYYMQQIKAYQIIFIDNNNNEQKFKFRIESKENRND